MKYTVENTMVVEVGSSFETDYTTTSMILLRIVLINVLNCTVFIKQVPGDHIVFLNYRISYKSFDAKICHIYHNNPRCSMRSLSK